MGQRSQIVVAYKDVDTGKIVRQARHLQWNYGRSMVQRASQVVEYLDNFYADKPLRHPRYDLYGMSTGVLSLFRANMASGSVESFYPNLDDKDAENFDNNDGYFFVFLGEDDFSASFATYDYDNEEIVQVDVEGYLNPYIESQQEYLKENNIEEPKPETPREQKNARRQKDNVLVLKHILKNRSVLTKEKFEACINPTEQKAEF